MEVKDLEIWKLAEELVEEIHALTLNDLPKFEMYETGSQIRMSAKSVKANITEGLGRRRYKKEFIHFLTIAKGSADETLDHLETLYRTKSLKDPLLYEKIRDLADKLARKLCLFIKAVETNNH